jgi:uncharacterized membrane protein YphA (DoxX/SURF4 family)
MLANLMKPKVDGAALVLRLGLAAIFIVHGTFKLYQDAPLLAALSLSTQIALGWIEVICGVLLAIGLLSRLATVPLIIEQITAIVVVTWPRALRGPAITPTGADYTKVGPEFNLVLIAMCFAVILLGSGVFSVDHYLNRWLSRKTGSPAPTPTPTPVPTPVSSV